MPKVPKKRPLEIQVIEEMENDDASINPYGFGISPNAMAGENNSVISLNKIFANQYSTKTYQG